MKKKIFGMALLVLSLVILLVLATSCTKKEQKEVGMIDIDYKEMTYVGNSLKDFSKLFDEQTKSGDPLLGEEGFPYEAVSVYDADFDGDIDEDDLDVVFDVTVDLKCVHYLECIYVFYSTDNCEITAEAGTPFKYEFSETVTG